MIENILETEFIRLGVRKSEANLYLRIIEIGAASISDIQKKTLIPRTTIKDNLQKLINKGLVNQVKKGLRNLYIAQSPSKLKSLIVEKQLELENNLSNLKELENKLPDFVKSIYTNTIQFDGNSNVVVKFLKGKKEIASVYKDCLNSNEIYSFANLDKYYEIFPEYLQVWKDSYLKNKKRIQYDIVIDTDLSREIGQYLYGGYFIKYLPKKTTVFANFHFSDYMIYDNKVSLIQLDPKNITCVTIESSLLCLGFKELHKVMWELL